MIRRPGDVLRPLPANAPLLLAGGIGSGEIVSAVAADRRPVLAAIDPNRIAANQAGVLPPARGRVRARFAFGPRREQIRQPGERETAVQVLRALFPGDGAQPGRQVGGPDGAFGAVDVLAAGAAGPQGVDPHRRFIPEVGSRLREGGHADEPVLAAVMRPVGAGADPLDGPQPASNDLRRLFAAGAQQDRAGIAAVLAGGAGDLRHGQAVRAQVPDQPGGQLSHHPLALGRAAPRRDLEPQGRRAHGRLRERDGRPDRSNLPDMPFIPRSSVLWIQILPVAGLIVMGVLHGYFQRQIEKQHLREFHGAILVFQEILHFSVIGIIFVKGHVDIQLPPITFHRSCPGKRPAGIGGDTVVGKPLQQRLANLQVFVIDKKILAILIEIATVEIGSFAKFDVHHAPPLIAGDFVDVVDQHGHFIVLQSGVFRFGRPVQHVQSWPFGARVTPRQPAAAEACRRSVDRPDPSETRQQKQYPPRIRRDASDGAWKGALCPVQAGKAPPLTAMGFHPNELDGCRVAPVVKPFPIELKRD
jgi:hypothetical protein